ncbi:MAG: phasin family protein [Sphingomonas fennica]
MADPRQVKTGNRRGAKPAAPVAPFVTTEAPPSPREAVESMKAAVEALPTATAPVAATAVAQTMAKSGEQAAAAAKAVAAKTAETVKTAAAPVAKASVSAAEQAVKTMAATAEASTDAAVEAAETTTAAAQKATDVAARTASDAIAQTKEVAAGTVAAVAAAAPTITHAQPAAPAASNPLKGYMTMATAAPQNAQAMFGEINDRAKGMMEKTSRMGEEMVEFTKGNVEAIVASARVAAKGSEALVQDAAEYGKKSFEQATAAFKGLASAKSPTELFQLQSDYAKTSFDAAVAEASKTSEAMLKLMGEVFQPLSNRYAVASEKVKATTSAY